jgi:hypothetical protein
VTPLDEALAEKRYNLIHGSYQYGYDCSDESRRRLARKMNPAERF